MSKTANKSGQEGSPGGINFKLNDFIPTKKGFYKYAATLPWGHCAACTHYVVYDIDSAISLSSTTIASLKTILKPSNKSVYDSSHKSINYAYNKTGAQHGLLSDEDKIYIDCQQTGASGQTLVSENKSAILNNNSFTMDETSTPDSIIKNQQMASGIAIALAATGAISLSYLLVSQQSCPAKN